MLRVLNDKKNLEWCYLPPCKQHHICCNNYILTEVVLIKNCKIVVFIVIKNWYWYFQITHERYFRRQDFKISSPKHCPPPFKWVLPEINFSSP